MLTIANINQPIVVRPRNITDIAETLTLVSKYKVDLAIHSGGHFTSPASSTAFGIVLSLSHLNSVNIDPLNRIAVIQPGANSGDISRAAAAHGLAAVVPNVSKVGFVGATLCGGLGHWTSQHGLMVDQILTARVVLADGRVVQANRDENYDLFWAIGGAGGMFGIVIEVTVKLHQVSEKDGLVFAGALMYQLDHADELMRAINDTVPDKGARGSLMLVVAAPPPTMTPMLIASIFYDGNEQDAKYFFRKLFDVGPMMDHTSMMPAVKAGSLVDWTAEMGRRQSMGSGAFQTPLKREILDEVLAKFKEFIGRSPEGMSAEILFHFTSLDRLSTVKIEDNVFPCRGQTQQVMTIVSHVHEADDSIAKNFLDEIEAFLRGSLTGDLVKELSVYTGYDSK